MRSMVAQTSPFTAKLNRSLKDGIAAGMDQTVLWFGDVWLTPTKFASWASEVTCGSEVHFVSEVSPSGEARFTSEVQA